MIIYYLINGILEILKAILSVIPSLPPLPQFISTAIDWLASLMGNVVGLFSYIYTPVIFIFAITAVMVTLNMKNIYHFIMFIVRKLPIGSS